MGGSNQGYRAFNVYSYITLLLFLFLGSVSIHLAKNVEEKSVSVGATAQQIIPDWQTTPFIDIKLQVLKSSDATQKCPTGYVALYSRIWQGMYAACDCLDAYDPYSDPSANYNFNQYSSCNSTQTQNGCQDVQAWPAMYMDILTP